MIKINRLYCEPELFDEIIFDDGLNLILGEKTPESDKTNGVGKSLAIEFINYCLLKEFRDCRVSRISADDFSHKAMICLDISINHRLITIKRSIEDHERPTVIFSNETIIHNNLRDAINFLSSLLFDTRDDIQTPSFRSILGPLIRDERSEFKSIINCFDTNKKIPPDYTPHLYLLGIDPANYLEAKKIQKDIDNISNANKKLKSDIELLTGKSFKDARLDLNDLKSQVERIKNEMDQLENVDAYEITKNELIDLEEKIENCRMKHAVFKSELSKLQMFKGDHYIDENEVKELFNRFKAGLGSMIQKDLSEVMGFKRKIDDFQRTLIESRREKILINLSELRSDLQNLDSKYKEKLLLIDHNGALRNLKITILTYQKKLEALSQLTSFLNKYDEYETQKKIATRKRSDKIVLLDLLVAEAKSTIEFVQEKILAIHEFVMGNRHCFFNVEVNASKEIMKFELRIYDDGCHSNEREKVFLYDLALLLTNELNGRHPGLLIHDNIFDVDQDTLEKSLTYLFENEIKLSQKQYILTINSDKLQGIDNEKLLDGLEKFKKASFTKKHRFLRKQYQEI